MQIRLRRLTGKNACPPERMAFRQSLGLPGKAVSFGVIYAEAAKLKSSILTVGLGLERRWPIRPALPQLM